MSVRSEEYNNSLIMSKIKTNYKLTAKLLLNCHENLRIIYNLKVKNNKKMSIYKNKGLATKK